ncbi:MAG: hypothetical protein IKA31_02155, partial [Clostridia bacterium]|nr:hypothetical protein [Clostridia bacterium]
MEEDQREDNYIIEGQVSIEELMPTTIEEDTIEPEVILEGQFKLDLDDLFSNQNIPNKIESEKQKDIDKPKEKNENQKQEYIKKDIEKQIEKKQEIVSVETIEEKSIEENLILEKQIEQEIEEPIEETVEYESIEEPQKQEDSFIQIEEEQEDLQEEQIKFNENYQNNYTKQKQIKESREIMKVVKGQRQFTTGIVTKSINEVLHESMIPYTE